MFVKIQYYQYFCASLFQHGESENNVNKKLGGDSDLTVRGEEVS